MLLLQLSQLISSSCVQEPELLPFPQEVRAPLISAQEPKLPALGYRLVVQPDEGIEPLLQAIRAARSRLLLKSFRFDQTEVREEIIAAHQRGVAVRILLNPVRRDGRRPNDEVFAAFEAAGVAVAWSNPQFEITHEKSMVVDHQVWIMTFNLCDKFFTKTRGYAIVSDHAGEVEEVAACFEADWQRLPFAGHGQLLWSGINARQRIAELIDGAKTSLDLQHPLLADSSILDRLMAALERGVKVRFLSSGQDGVNGPDLLENAASLRMLKRMGAKVHKIKKPKIHSKMMIVDGKVAQLGSMNLSRHCFEVRRELGIVIQEKAVVQRLKRTFEYDWENSKVFHAPDPLTVPIA